MANTGDDNPPKRPPDDAAGPASDDPLDELARLMGAAGLQPPAGYDAANDQSPSGGGEGWPELEFEAATRGTALAPEPAAPVTASRVTDESLLTGDPVIDDALADDGFLDDDPVDLADLEAEIADLGAALPEPVRAVEEDDLLADLDFGDLAAAPSTSTSTPASAPVAAAPQPAPVVEPAPAPTPQPPAAPELTEDDLLAAMDELAAEDANARPPSQPSGMLDPGLLAAGAVTSAAASAAPKAAPASPAAPAPAAQAAPAAPAQPPAEQPFDFEPDFGNLVDDPALDPGVPPLDPVSENPPYVEEPQPAESKGGRGLVFALAGVALVALAGVVAFGLVRGDGGDSGAPELIAADDGEIKVDQPVDAEARPAQPGDTVFSNLEGDETTAEGTPRIVLPAPGEDALAARVEPTIPSAEIAPIPPGSTAARPVRTVTVLADGTVVNVTEEADAATQEATDAADAATQVVEETAQAVSATARDALASADDALDALAGEVTSEVVSTRPVQTIAVGPGTDGQVADSQVPAVELPAAQTQAPTALGTPSVLPPVPVARPAGLTGTQVATAPAAPAAQTAAPVQLGTPAQTQPVQTQPVQAPQAQLPQTQLPQAQAPAATEQAAAAQVVTSGDFVVQLASLRSREQANATFSNLQGRFGTILGAYSPNIQEVDLGDRGIFHRVRVGPMDRSQADELCQRYQSAGGDCFVQRQ
ncbi:MAG: SPOR domain-containing protein [Devosiaceae bacterium]|nr:SPOR domain-containing protein [Devosiaceae bacterium MH13]